MRPWESPFPNPHLPLALKKKKEEVELISRNVPLPLTLPSFGVPEKCFLFFLKTFYTMRIFTPLLSLLINVCKEAGSQIFTSPVFSLPNFAFSGQDSNCTRSQRYSCTDSWKRRRLLVPPEGPVSRCHSEFCILRSLGHCEAPAGSHILNTSAQVHSMVQVGLLSHPSPKAPQGYALLSTPKSL